MMNIVTKWFVLFVISTLFIGCGANTNVNQVADAPDPNPSTEKNIIYSSAEYPTYADVNQLTEYADLVVKGTVLDSSVEVIDVAGPPIPEDELDNPYRNPHPDLEQPEIEPLELVFTVQDVKVEEVYKGAVEEDIIQIKQPGGELEDEIHIEEDIEMLKHDHSYIMFLRTFDDVPASLLNPFQAAHLVENDTIRPHHSMNESLILHHDDISEIKQHYDE